MNRISGSSKLVLGLLFSVLIIGIPAKVGALSHIVKHSMSAVAASSVSEMPPYSAVSEASSTLQETDVFLPIVRKSRASGEWIAYRGVDGNVYLISSDGSRSIQVTEDGSLGTSPPRVDYRMLNWSPNGQMLAFNRTDLDANYESQSSIQIYDLATETIETLVTEEGIYGLDWMPDGSGIVYGPPTPWINPPEEGPVLGIYHVDLSSRVVSELVSPENGKPLVRPNWSPDGRFLAFEEARLKGVGAVAMYDTVSGEYLSDYGPLGTYSWSPDGKRLVYDTIGYSLILGSRLWVLDVLLPTERYPLTTANTLHYDARPEFSPVADELVYLRIPEELEQEGGELWLAAGSPFDGSWERRLSNLNVTNPSWAHDGKQLAVQIDSYTQATIHVIDVDSGDSVSLANGVSPAWQP